MIGKTENKCIWSNEKYGWCYIPSCLKDREVGYFLPQGAKNNHIMDNICPHCFKDIHYERRGEI